MWRKKIGRRLGAAWLLLGAQLVGTQSARAIENFSVKAFVPTFGGSTSLGANVSTILYLRLLTTLRPWPKPNPDNLYFGVGQVEWSRRSINETPEAAMEAAVATGSHMALWGAVEEYGPGVVVTSNLVVPASQPTVNARVRWSVGARNAQLEIGLPNISYQFSPLVIDKEVVAQYSRPNQLRVCGTKALACNGPSLGDPFRAIRIEGDYALVRQPNATVGWVALPNLSEAQGEVVDFTAALISYLRGDFEQAETYFGKVRDSKAESLVRNDAALLAGISTFRRGRGIEALRMVHAQKPYSRFAVQALVMADIAVAAKLPAGDLKASHAREAGQLIESYRHLFAPGDPWLRSADRSLRGLD
jgi:hypothetical protein